MGSPIVLDAISFASDFETLVKQVRAKKGTPYYDDLLALWNHAQEIAKPKVLFKPAFVESPGDEHVFLDGIQLKSRLLRDNLKDSHRVFPFVGTCGTELNNWAKSCKDMMHSFFAETIKQAALTSAIQHLDSHIRDFFSTGDISIMTPGSLEDWPISQQSPLFEILGDVEGTIGVQLMESLMMSPVQSVSGIVFPTKIHFESCRLCPRKNCPGRRAGYDKDLHEKIR